MARLLGEILIARGHLTPEGLDRALRAQQAHYRRIGEILLHLGLISDVQRAEALADQLGLDVARTRDFPDTAVLNGSVTPGFLRKSKILPLDAGDEIVRLAMADPLDRFSRDAIAQAVGRPVDVQVAPESEIDAALEGLYEPAAVSLSDHDQTESDIRHLEQRAQEAPVIRVVERTIERAVEMGASDIHFETYERQLVVRCRVDGVLQDLDKAGAGLAAPVISRLKILADLDIAERRRPQDGRLKLTRRGSGIDMRISTLPGLHGESAALRLLDRTPVAESLDGLGMTEQAAARLRLMLRSGHGIVLVTGPTGSGKTTTLYTILKSLRDGGSKIVSIEDPIEYEIDGITQVPVNSEIGVGFAEVLRSTLRHDPDIIMVGEMRDRETAEIAVQSALTGHLVLSTLHTNDAPGTVTRLMDMGIEPYLIASTLAGVVAQRLVRVLCPACRGEASAGCETCRGTGYRGRQGLFEVMPMTPRLREQVSARATAEQLADAAVGDGMVTLARDGAEKVREGVTSQREVDRVVRSG